MPGPVNVVAKLQPQRRRMALKAYQLLRFRIPASDEKKYAAGKEFLPIFPTDDTALWNALNIVTAQLEAVLFPNP